MALEDIRVDVEKLQKEMEKIEDGSIKAVLSGILSVLRKVDVVLDELSDQISVIDEDLSEIEDSYRTDTEFMSMKCVHCGEEFFVAADDYQDGNEVICPNCGGVNIIRL